MTSTIPLVLPSQEKCPMGQPTLQFCEMWCNCDPAEKQRQGRDDTYCSLRITSFELMANGFWVLFCFSRSIWRFNSYSSPLALSTLLSLLNHVYNFAFPRVTNILVLGSFNIKRRGLDPLCKTWFTCFTSPLCNLSAEWQINIQLIHSFLPKKLVKSI